MAFVYYIPGARQNDVKKNAQKSGILDYALEWDADQDSSSDVTIFANGTTRGPDDASGGLLHQGEGVPFDLDSQEWVKHPNEDYWVGYDPENPPTPSDLEKRDMVGKYEISLGNTGEWLLPTAAGYEDGECPLPKSRQVDPETGELERRPLKKYDQLRIYADEIREAALQSNEDHIHLERETDICIEALQTNYRLGILEASMLELLTDEAVKLILWTLIDRLQWPDALEEMQDSTN